MAIVETEALTKVHGEGDTEVHALDGVDLSMQPGEFVAVMPARNAARLNVVDALHFE